MDDLRDAGPAARKTAWARRLATPLRSYVRAEAGGALVLLAATIAALVWANVDLHSYEQAWGTQLSIRLGGASLHGSLREWIDDGLMAIFFLVVGLEARRELDMGDLRERRRIALPVLAALGGMALPVATYAALNGGTSAAHGWGVAMSTDTAFAIGLLSLVGPRLSDRLRAFMVTLLVVDDLVALCVIATAYTSRLSVTPLVVALALLGALLVARAAGLRIGLLYAVLGIALWVAVRASGIDPIVVGLAMGLLTYARPPARTDLEQASDLFRAFREQPTPRLARAASSGLESALSPNERLQHRFHPWSSYAIVPLFALANAGIALHATFLRHALGSPIVIGIAAGYVLGKPLGIATASWLAQRGSRGALRPPVGWGALVGGGAAGGIGFTVALLIAGRALHGEQLAEAKLGILLAAALASLVSWGVFAAIRRMGQHRRLALLVGGAEQLEDLAEPVDAEVDHVRGPHDAPVTLVEYGDFECPYCGRAEPVVRELLADFGDLRYVWRHLPLSDVHPHAQLAAEASEAAAEQDAFWELHALLFARQDALGAPDLLGYAEQLGLDRERFKRELRERTHGGRVARDLESADLSGVSGTPTFFVNGRRHHGAYDLEALTAAVRAARARVLVAG